MLLLIPSRKQCAGVDVSLCSLSIRLDSEVLTHPEIPIPMGTCPRKAGPARLSLHPRPLPPLRAPLDVAPRPPFPHVPSSPKCPAINSAVSRYAQFAVALKYTDFKARLSTVQRNASRRQRLLRGCSHLGPPRLRVCHGPEFFGVHFVSRIYHGWPSYARVTHNGSLVVAVNPRRG